MESSFCAGERFFCYLRQRPQAQALIRGSAQAPQVCGRVFFYQTPLGVLVATSIRGFPHSDKPCSSGIFAMHIHEGAACTGTPAFADAGGHYNPEKCEHPHHAGDLPPLFSNRGFAWSIVLTDRFTVEDILGRTVIIHAGVDDFTSQPAGNAGARIACGEITPVWGCCCNRPSPCARVVHTGEVMPEEKKMPPSCQEEKSCPEPAPCEEQPPKEEPCPTEEKTAEPCEEAVSQEEEFCEVTKAELEKQAGVAVGDYCEVPTAQPRGAEKNPVPEQCEEPQPQSAEETIVAEIPPEEELSCAEENEQP